MDVRFEEEAFPVNALTPLLKQLQLGGFVSGALVLFVGMSVLIDSPMLFVSPVL